MVLHYSYTNWHDLVGKTGRACPQRYLQAERSCNDTWVGGHRLRVQGLG